MMRQLRVLLLRLGGLFRKRASDQEIADELESHLQMHVADNLRRGMNPREARREALMKLGGVAQTAESYRERRGVPVIETLLQDLRFALRSLRKNPGFTAVAVLVMALGIGANTAMFSVVNAVLLRPLAYRDADRIVKLRTMWKKDGGGNQVSAPDYHDWHDQSTAFEAMANYNNFGETAVSIGPTAEYAMMASVSSEFFDVFSIQPVIGRLFSPEEF